MLLCRPDDHFSAVGPGVENQFVFRTVPDLTSNQIEKEQTQHKVKADEAYQRENSVPAIHDFAVAVAGVKEPVDQPRLTTEFSCHPAHDVADVRKRKRQHQHPEQPGARFESAAPILEPGISHNKDENRAQCNHEVKRIVQKLDVVWPCALGISLQPVHITLKSAVG